MLWEIKWKAFGAMPDLLDSMPVWGRYACFERPTIRKFRCHTNPPQYMYLALDRRPGAAEAMYCASPFFPCVVVVKAIASRSLTGALGSIGIPEMIMRFHVFMPH
jgi:hypothetical protein